MRRISKLSSLLEDYHNTSNVNNKTKDFNSYQKYLKKAINEELKSSMSIIGKRVALKKNPEIKGIITGIAGYNFVNIVYVVFNMNFLAFENFTIDELTIIEDEKEI